MKTLLTLVTLALICIGCDTTPTSNDLSASGISLSTEKTSYARSDSITLYIENKSNRDIELGYRCGYNNLEMYFQKKENGVWSDNLWFDYMSLKCMTLIRKYKKNKTVKHTLAATQFKGSGTFRLIFPVHTQNADSAAFLTSNAFEIK